VGGLQLVIAIDAERLDPPLLLSVNVCGNVPGGELGKYEQSGNVSGLVVMGRFMVIVI